MYRGAGLTQILTLTWNRMKVIAAIIGDLQAQFVVTFFYYTLLVPFGLIARYSGDTLRLHSDGPSHWASREAVPSDLEAAKRQG